MNTSAVTKQWLGLPLNLVWGYIAIALFMTGDGFELAFLSHHITSLGFTQSQSSLAFSVLWFGRGAIGLGVGRVCRNHHAAQGDDYRLCAVVRVSYIIFGVWLG